jgi:hypothetical protein
MAADNLLTMLWLLPSPLLLLLLQVCVYQFNDSGKHIKCVVFESVGSSSNNDCLTIQVRPDKHPSPLTPHPRETTRLPARLPPLVPCRAVCCCNGSHSCHGIEQLN